MTQHTNFSTRLDDLQQRVAHGQVGGAERRDRVRGTAQGADRPGSGRPGPVSRRTHEQEVSQAADSARAKWAQLKADAAAKMSDVKANIDKRTRHMDAKVAANDADWAEADAAEALDFADWAVENAQLAILDAIHARAYADKLVKAADNS